MGVAARHRTADPAGQPDPHQALVSLLALVAVGDDTALGRAIEPVTPPPSLKARLMDAANDRLTMLVRMNAGTSYPAHRHRGVEECYVLEGDLYGPNFEMRAGDYQRLAGGSVHGVQGTRGGCSLFIVSLMNDELLPSHP